MKITFTLLISLFLSQISKSQTFEQLGIKFNLKDSLITFENIDKKFKTIKITEKDSTNFGIIELKINYDIEGEVIENHKLYTKDGVIEIEIISDKLKKLFSIKR